MTKVKQGFTAARIPVPAVVKIFNMFDRLSEQDARTVALRTEFSVSTSAKFGALFESGNAENKRQMARAAMFLEDLSALASNRPLAEKISDADFEKMWRGEELGLQSMLNALVQHLCAPPPPTPAPPTVEAVTVPLTPIPPKPKVHVPFATLKLLKTDERDKLIAVLTRAEEHQKAVRGGTATGPTSAVMVAWSNAKTELISAFAQKVNTSLAQMTSMQTASNGAYTEFKKFVAEAAAEVEFYIDIAKKVFGALKDAPFPFSVVGTIGETICGALHVDSAVPQTRTVGDRQYFNSDIPLLASAKIKFETASASVSELTRLGVDGSKLPSRTKMADALDQAKNRSIVMLNKVFKDTVATTYGEGPDDVRAKYLAFANKVRADVNPNMPWVSVEPLILIKIQSVYELTRKTIFGDCGNIVVDSVLLQPFIELDLYASYMAQICPGDDFDVTVPDSLIRRLEAPPFQLVVRKTGSGQTAQIYASKKLPWGAHPRHIGAVVLFFRWYSKKVNPFHIVAGRTTPEVVWKTIEAAIVEIGNAIAANTVTRRLRTTDTADWGAVRTALRL
jgi:hypothetical protein